MNRPFRITILVVVCAFLVLCATWVKADDSRKQEQVIQEFDVAKGGLLVIPVTIGGNQFGFVLDTGSTRSVIDQSLREYVGRFLGKEVWAAASGRGVTMDLFECTAASVGKLPLPEGSPVGLTDLAFLRRYTGQKIYGFLGMDFLRTRVMRINFDEGEITFLREIGEDAGQEIPLLLSDDWKMPCVENLISSQKSERFQIDTGMFGISGHVRPELFAALAKQGKIYSSRRAGYKDASGMGSTTICRLDKIKIGEFEEHGLLFATGANNVIGLGFLSRFIVTFDFPNEKMYVKKGEKLGSPDQVLVASNLGPSTDDQPRPARFRNRLLRRGR